MSSNDRTAGWRPDPYARAEQRYYDGSVWTPRIRNGDAETTDPLGATATIPFTNPTGITLQRSRSGVGGVIDRISATFRRIFGRR